MARTDAAATVSLSMDPAAERARVERPDSETPFRILLLGDFSGRASRQGTLGGALRATEVTPENIEQLPGKLNAELRLAPPGFPEFTLRIRDLEDLYPERLIGQIPAASIGAVGPEMEAEATRPPLPESGNLLDAILGGGASPAAERTPSDPLRAAINRIVDPHTVKEPSAADRQRAAAAAQTDAERLRRVMADPAFRQFESNWRTLFWMLGKLPVGVELQIHVADLTRDEAARELNAGGGQLARLLVDDVAGTEGGHPWAVVAALWPLQAAEEDLDLIYGMGQLARMAAAPFLAGVAPGLAGCADVRQSADPREWQAKLPVDMDVAWAALRGSDVAPWIGLTTPRWLVRLPYGEGGLSSDVESFDEAASGNQEANFLWGSGAAFCAVLLGTAFERDGWNFTPESSLALDGMSVYVRGSGVAAEAMSSTEAWLGERAAERILDCGLMPLVTVKNRDVVRLVRWQSIASPPSRLRGRWE